jgi:nicotinate dehydrogenase subunit A
MIAFTLNGAAATVDLPADTPLLAVIRDHLGLFGSRFGCGAEQCGACMMLIDGRAEYSCTRTLDSVKGRDVVTVEGLGHPGTPHPLQQAFLAEQANPQPDAAAARKALNGNLCRCGAHNRIIRAVLRAAAQLRGEKDVA